MRIGNLVRSGLVTAAVLTCAGVASGRDGALAFIRTEHQGVTALLRQPPSASRDAQVDNRLGNFVDYDELTRRAFGQPCPPGRSSCTNYWATLSPAQRAEVTPLLKKLVMKTEKKNVLKLLDYDVAYKGERESGSEWTVRLEATSKSKPRDPPLLMDYVVVPTDNTWHVVDIVTEGSSRTKNYYEQFNRMLTNPSQGYPHVVTRLKETIAKKEADTSESK